MTRRGVNLIVDNTRIEHMINTVGSGTTAVNLNDAVVASVRNSVLAWARRRRQGEQHEHGGPQRVFVMGSQLTRLRQRRHRDGRRPRRQPPRQRLRTR